jgi:hypothetical protein
VPLALTTQSSDNQIADPNRPQPTPPPKVTSKVATMEQVEAMMSEELLLEFIEEK